MKIEGSQVRSVRKGKIIQFCLNNGNVEEM